MGNYLPPGACDAEYEAAKEARAHLDDVLRDFHSAADNQTAAGLSMGGAALLMVGCGALGGPIGIGLCLAGTGTGTVGGAYWTKSATNGLVSARDNLREAFKDTEEKIDKTCDCLDENTICVPD